MRAVRPHLRYVRFRFAQQLRMQSLFQAICFWLGPTLFHGRIANLGRFIFLCFGWRIYPMGSLDFHSPCCSDG
jgi:hypothetical protein